MNLLLTGSNGFLGKSITKELSIKYNIYNLSRTFGEYIVSLEKEIRRTIEKLYLIE